MKFRNTLILVLSSTLAPAGAGERSTFAFTWENDSFLDFFGGRYTDRHYTQGLILSFYHRDAVQGGDDFFKSAEITRLVPHFGMDIEATRGGIALGQQMYTPEEIEIANRLIQDDRPYAGYLFLQPQWERRGMAPSFWGGRRVPTRDRFSVSLGLVGPSSRAEDIQTKWHELFNGVEPSGWDFQLQDEFTINFHAERTWLFTTRSDTSTFHFDLMPSIGFDLGSVSTRLTTGLEARFGIGHIHEFTTSALESGESRYGGYLFGTARGWAVAHNIFLDENVYQASHSVDKEGFVGEVSLGVGFHTNCLDFRAAWVRRSTEFDLQDVPNSYLSATMGFRF